MLIKLSLVLSALMTLSRATGGTKQWRPSAKFDFFGNWVGRALPCPLDRVVFPRDLGAQVHLSASSLRVREIVLPNDGSLQMPEFGELLMTDEIYEKSRVAVADDKIAPFSDKAACKRSGKDALFRADIRRRWASPHSWMLIEKPNESFPRMGGPAIPHGDSIPCQEDSVVFPEEGSFAVEMPSITQYVKGIVHGKERLSETSWKDLIDSQSDVFYVSDDVRGNAEVVIRLADKSAKGPGEGFTPCQPHIPPLEMCDSAQRHCGKPMCLNPIRPRNHCCDICGGMIVFQPSGDLKLTTIAEMLNSEMGGSGSKLSEKIWWWASGVSGSSPPMVQIVLVEGDTYDGSSVELTKRLHEKLRSSGVWKNAMEASQSGLAWDGARSAGGGWAAVITLGVVLLAFGVLLMLYYPPSSAAAVAQAVARPFRPFDFVRFDNRSREGSLALGISQMDITQIDKAFDNPMYATLLQKQKTEEVYEVKQSAPPESSDDDDSETNTETAFKE